MSKLVKELITDELRDRYADVESALWVELVGADGTSTNEFRRELHARRMRLEVVKNSLFRRALGESRLGRLAEALKGPAAIVTGGDSLIDVAKLIEEWSPRLKGLRMRAAVLEGEFIDEGRIEQLPKMPTKRDLQGRVVSCVRAPGANLAAAMLSGGSNIASCLKAMIEKLEKGETIQAA